MPFARGADGTQLAFEVFGNPAGEPVLMIQGLGANGRGWARQRRALGRHFRGIVFDNRGAGRSDKPPGPYDLEVMAADAVTVLEAAGYQSAHVMGASMGGIIAQVLAVRHPERVRSLVLACTACRHHGWRRELLADWARVASEEGMRRLAELSLRWLVGPRLHRRLAVPANLLWPLVAGAPADAFVSQVQAILAIDDALRFELAGVTVPTLVVTGSQDALTPLGDAEELAEMIPGARLEILWGAAHALMVEHASAFNRAVLEFLDTVAVSPTAIPAAGA